jgi:RNA polymerase sigma-70 factor (ECF subfamily)
MLQEQEDASDAAQETFIAAYKNLPNFRGDAKVSSWLHRIAVNQCLTKKRRAKVRNESSLETENSTDEINFSDEKTLSPSRQFEQTERLRLIRQAVSALPADLRQVIIMKEFEEMTFQQISDVLEIPLSTVKSRVYTALKQLRLKLEQAALEVV